MRKKNLWVKGKCGLSLAAFFLALFSCQLAFAGNDAPKRKRAVSLRPAEVREAKQKLAELGYWTGRADGAFDAAARVGLIAFQKAEGRAPTGKLTRDELDALRAASKLQPRDTGYAHVEVDLDRQILFIVNEDNTVTDALPISSGSNKEFHEKGMSGTAYTPRGRFRIYSKLAGWHRSPLGLLYYPNYISDGIAIHGNNSVPNNPASHGCIRIPVAASPAFSRAVRVGTIVLVYDKESFVSAKDWAKEESEPQPVRIGKAKIEN
jgi:lipoprotein-anchoring transpeptidase ErfK/SrfK